MEVDLLKSVISCFSSFQKFEPIEDDIFLSFQNPAYTVSFDNKIRLKIL